MAEEEDDDESFGDFTFASFPNQPFPSTSNHHNPSAADDVDDDWGDFVNHSNQINGGSSKPFDPFGAPPDPTDKHVNNNNGIAVQANKPRGAIPLSIFGEEDKDEDEKEEPASASAFFSNKSNGGGGAVKRGSDSNGTFGIGDLISNLYNQQPQVNSQNGSASISNVAAPNPNADGPTNSNGSDLNQDSDDEDGWEFKSAEWENGNKSQNVKVEVPKHDNGAAGVGALLGSSNGISDKAGEWNLGFEFSPSSVSHSLQPGPMNESNETGNGLTMFDQNFGNLKNAHSWSGSNQTLEAPKKAEIYPTNIEVLKYDGGASHSTIDLSLASESHQSDGWDFRFNFNSGSLGQGSSHISESHFKTKSNQDENNKSNASPRTPTNINVDSDVNLFESKDGEGSHISESYFKTESNQDENNKSNASPTNINVDSDVNLFESEDAVTETGTKQEKPLISSENRREALPLSIFGDEMPDTNEHSVSQDWSPYAPVSPIRNNFNSPGSNLSINDLWNLYNQAENKTSPNVTPKASENQMSASPEISGSNLVDSDDFDDDFGDFMDATPGTRIAQESAQKPSFNHAPQVNENGLQSSLTVLSSDVINGNDGFENHSWEFKDAVSGSRSRDQASSIDHRDFLTQLSTELEPTDCVEFFSKLKDEMCNDVLFHLQNLKKAQDVAALSGEDAKAKALEVEVQEFSEILHQDNMSIPNEYLSENYSPRNVNFNELLEVLKEPKFQHLESEYQLASKLSMAKKDKKSAMGLLKDAVSTLRILKLGSREEKSNYLTIWSKIAFVCSQELKHGAYIWKLAVQKNVHDQILSNPKGVQYIHALGEIYRAAEIIGASAKLHKPWMLSGSIDPTSFFALLNECSSLWLASGLEEALFSVSNQNNFDSNDISRELVASIKYIHELDEQALQSYIISGEETTCQLSALPAGCIPGLNLVTWNEKHYFVKLANLWVNLISSDPPK